VYDGFGATDVDSTRSVTAGAASYRLVGVGSRRPVSAGLVSYRLVGVESRRPVSAGFASYRLVSGVVGFHRAVSAEAGAEAEADARSTGAGVADGRSGGVVAQAPSPARSSAGVDWRDRRVGAGVGVGAGVWVTHPPDELVLRGTVLSTAGRGAYCGVESVRLRASRRAWVSAQAWLSVRGWALAQKGDSPSRGA
jgi:hypothetical protein